MKLQAAVLSAWMIFHGGAIAEVIPPEPKAGQSQEEAGKELKRDDAKKPDESEAEPYPKTATRHSVSVAGRPIEYTATAGMLPLKDADGKTTAQIFFIAYTRDTPEGVASRPVTFSFNGGPGSSSVWMHLGLLGPRRVKLNDDGSPPPPPYALVDNEHTLLDETDLVFIDPVGTGYSRATKLDDAKKFYGVAEDARSVAEFIRLYVTKNSRWASPKFLVGESYGTIRAAALSEELAQRHRMNLNGIMLLSVVLNFQTIWGGEGNDLPHVLYLPSYTATAWYHKRLEPGLQGQPLGKVLKEAEVFATEEYQPALMLGAMLPAVRRKEVLQKMARLTGLSVDWLDRANMRPGLGRFSVELLRDRDLQTGRFDSRYTGHVRNRLAQTAEGDPSADAVFNVFGATFNHYVRTELGYEEERPYEILASLGSWNWGANNDFVNVADTLAAAMVRNPHLKVHVSCGYTDMATPYFATRYTFNHLNVPGEIARNVTIDHYTAGHMMYLNLPDLIKQKADLARFIRATTGK